MHLTLAMWVVAAFLAGLLGCHYLFQGLVPA
jgi:hypothetical protein